MNAALRWLVIALALLGIVAEGYAAFTPDLYVRLIGLDTHHRIARAVIPPGGPAAAAGLHSGDVLDVHDMPLAQRIGLFASAPGGSTQHVTIVTAEGARDVAIAVPPMHEGLNPERLFDLALIFFYALFAVLVMLRAGDQRMGRMIVLLTLASQYSDIAADYQVTAPTPFSSFAIGIAYNVFGNVVVSTVALFAVAMLPAGMSRARRLLFLLAPLAGLLSVFDPTSFKALVTVLAPELPGTVVRGSMFLSALVDIALAALLFAIAETGPLTERMRARWFVSTIVIWFLGWVTMHVFPAPGPLIYGVTYVMLNVTVVGPIYATLRHRIVDLNFVISRSAVFAGLSVALLLTFMTAEWLTAEIADAFLGDGALARNLAQFLSFGIAIAVGLSLKRVHERLEARVNALIFRERNRKLRLLASFGREADLIESRPELLKRTYEALAASIDTDEIAIYANGVDDLTREESSTGEAPGRLERSDRVVLQARERRVPFVSEVASLHSWLVVPLVVRAELVGLIACGAKADRTAYLPDESRVLSEVAQHVATSYALL